MIFSTKQRLHTRSWPFRHALGLMAFIGMALNANQAVAVRPFVTDDARIVFPGQLEMENFAEVAVARGQKPTYQARSLQGVSVTDRLEIIAGGFGPVYENKQVKPVDLLFQPKYLLYRGFGAMPSVSVAAAELFPLSGNRQLWNSYAMTHISWFLFTPQESTDPYDNGLAIHLNIGTKSQFNAGLGGRYTTKPYWAAGFEVITFTREFRFLGEVFAGDPFIFEEKAPVFQTGFRWYQHPKMQWDIVWRSVRGNQDHSDTFQIGWRFLIDDVFPFR
jgi:hypothetical protein